MALVDSMLNSEIKNLHYLVIALKLPEYSDCLNFDPLITEQMQLTVPHVKATWSALSVH